jgi:hypothetical protein
MNKPPIMEKYKKSKKTIASPPLAVNVRRKSYPVRAKTPSAYLDVVVSKGGKLFSGIKRTRGDKAISNRSGSGTWRKGGIALQKPMN